MELSSQNFLYIFLPLVYAVYCLVGIKKRGMILLLASLYFYSSGNSLYLFVLLDFIVLNYFFGRLVDSCVEPVARSKAIIVSVAANLVILFVFKYLGFFCGILNSILMQFGITPVKVEPIALPLGLSFLTFQAIAYLVDVYRQDILPERNFIKFSLAFAFFPKLVAGPIVRMDQLEEALERPVITLDDFVAGFKRIIIGLGKKLILADTLAKTADQVFAIPSNDLTTPVAWLGIVCYTLQLYFDFSGYTDMALGLGRLFGYSLPENFDYPYSAKSLTEFWRRWHISLSTWFRDYLYIPLSYSLMTDKVRQKIVEGKYKTNYRALTSIIVVFTLCGLWHGASWNFVIWGGLHGVILALESWKFGKILKKAWAPLAHLYLLLIVMFCWVFFRLPTLLEAISFIKVLAGFSPTSDGLNQLRFYTSIELIILLFIAGFASLPLKKIIDYLVQKTNRWSGLSVVTGDDLGCRAITIIESVALAAILLASMQAVAGTVSKTFIYGQF